jgi:rubrerythrin
VNLHTASEVISFARGLESESAKFYDILSQRYAQNKDVFLAFAKENGKNTAQVERSYYGVITDAIEGCFSFDVVPDAYTLKTDLAENASYPEALNKAIEIEEKMIKFYSDAAEQSQTLMADVPRVFKIIAKKRRNRVGELGSLLNK